MIHFPLADPDAEERYRKELRTTAADRKRDRGKVISDSYPDTCPECACRAFMCFTKYYCTNRQCKWFDRKHLGGKHPSEHNDRGLS